MVTVTWLGPGNPGEPGAASPPINVPPGTYEYTIDCGTAKAGADGDLMDIIVGFVTVAEPIPTLSAPPLILLGLVVMIVGLWFIRRRRAQNL